MKDSTYYKLDRLPLSVTGNELAMKEAMKSLRGWLVSQARGPTALGVCMVLAGLAGFGCSSDLGLDGGPTDAMTDSDASIPRDVGPGDTGSPGDTASPDSGLGKACAASATAMSPSGARGGPIRGACAFRKFCPRFSRNSGHNRVLLTLIAEDISRQVFRADGGSVETKESTALEDAVHDGLGQVLVV